MSSVFLDTDAILDLLIEREPHHSVALRFFSYLQVHADSIQAFTSPLEIANVSYILQCLDMLHSEERSTVGCNRHKNARLEGGRFTPAKKPMLLEANVVDHDHRREGVVSDVGDREANRERRANCRDI